MQARASWENATKKVLITGADGLVGDVLRQHLADRYELRLMSHGPMDVPSTVADIADLDAIRPSFEGIDSVVHLAAASSPDSSWEDVLCANIIGARNVFEAARMAGVPQVVYASSGHAVGMYEVDGAPSLYDLDDTRSYDEHVEIRPDTLYGLSKAFGELCGRLYSDQHGLRVICLRIGYVNGSSEPLAPAEDDGGRRTRAIWLSHRDCAQLFRRAIDADHLRWAVAYGTSDNPRQVWDLTSARELLGYRPEDSAPV